MGNTKKRLVVMASGQGSNFQAIAAYLRSQSLPAEIIALVCDKPNAGVLHRAKKFNIPTIVIPRSDYATNEEFQHHLLIKLQQFSPDFILLAGFMRILHKPLVDAFMGKIINIHPALLPKFPGLHTHERVLAAHETYHGSTVHFVTPELDAGPIIAQARLKIAPNDTSESLQKRVQSLEHRLYPEVTEWLIEGRVQLSAQGVLLDGQALPLQGYQYAAHPDEISA